MMQCGGNQAAQSAFGEYVLSLNDIHAKYTSKAAQHYKTVLLTKAHQLLPHHEETINAPLIFNDNNTDSNSNNINNNNILIDVDPVSPITRPKTDAEFFAMWENAEIKDTMKKQGKNEDEKEHVSGKSSQPAAATYRQARHSAKTGVTKLGARKAQAGVFNYEEAEEREREQEGSVITTSPHRFSSPPATPSSLQKKPISSRLMYNEDNLSADNKKNNADDDKNNKQDADAELDRLGMGIARIGKFGYVPNGGGSKKDAASSTTSSKDDTEVTYARDKFGNAKSISSDQYFGRNEYDPSHIAANSARLARFQGATSISSDQYFDREPKFRDDVSSGYIRGTSTYANGSNGSNFSKKILGVASRGAAKVSFKLSY